MGKMVEVKIDLEYFKDDRVNRDFIPENTLVCINGNFDRIDKAGKFVLVQNCTTDFGETGILEIGHMYWQIESTFDYSVFNSLNKGDYIEGIGITKRYSHNTSSDDKYKESIGLIVKEINKL